MKVYVVFCKDGSMFVDEDRYDYVTVFLKEDDAKNYCDTQNKMCQPKSSDDEPWYIYEEDEAK